MKITHDILKESLSGNSSVLDILSASSLCLTIKNRSLEYVYLSNEFIEIFEVQRKVISDFDIFTKETAFEINQEDTVVLTSQLNKKEESVLIAKNGTEIIAKISRSIVVHDSVEYLVSLIQDITKDKQKDQFDAYKRVLTEPEVFEKMLNRFSSLIFDCSSEKEIFEGVGNLCLDLLDIKDLSFMLANHLTNELHQVLVVNRSQGVSYQDKGNYKVIPLNKGITGRCASELKTMVVDDVSLDPDYLEETSSIKSEISVPIIYKNKLIGVIDSESSKLCRYNLKIKRTLEGIASLLAIKLNELNDYKALELKNNDLKSLINDHPSAIAMLDDSGNYLEISAKWRSSFVKDKTLNVIGLNHFDLNPSIPEEWKKVFHSACKGNTHSANNEAYRRKNGKIAYFTAQINPWYKSDKSVGGVVIMAEDVTHKLENEIRLSRTNKDLIEARRQGRLYSWEFDMEAGLFKWSSKNIKVEGFNSDVRYSLDKIFSHISEEFHEQFYSLLKNRVKMKEGFSLVHPFEVNGRKYWLNNIGKPIYHGNELIKVIGTAQDITLQVAAENAYKEQNVELVKINEELDQFVYKTAHDLRAPLTNLVGLIGIMRLEDDKRILNSYLDLQENSIVKLDNFIQKITTYTKNTRLAISAEKLNITRIVDEVLRAHYYFENSDKIAKIVNIDKSFDYFSDPERVRIILANVISNAIKFCDLEKEYSKIELYISIENGQIHIKIRDNGLGIREETLPKVWNMFYRGHKIADGAGIGLYIVKETVMKLNGDIRIESKLGDFTELNVYLPNQQL